MTVTLSFRDPRLQRLPTLSYKVLFRGFSGLSLLFLLSPQGKGCGTATVAEVRTLLLTWCWWVDTPISQQPVTGALQGHGCGRLLVWRRTGMNLPRHQHPWQSELSPKLGSFYLKTGVALWEGKMTAKPKLAFGESSCAQMTRCKWGDLSKVPE